LLNPSGGGDRRGCLGPPSASGFARAAAEWLRARLPAGAGLSTDSRRLGTGDGFVAWPGYATDGRRFVTRRSDAGAAACIVEAKARMHSASTMSASRALAGLKSATGRIADTWYGEPSSRLEIVATTGTNGKTSTAWWDGAGAVAARPPLRRDRHARRRRAAFGAACRCQAQPTGLTTPDPITLHASLARFRRPGFAACAIEASSIGVVEHRLDGVRIAVALFTNFTRDHLDYHGDMAAYWAAKAELFAWPRLQRRGAQCRRSQGRRAGRATAGR
jgi:UDP-N-acetylmuramoyl-L-alanyl-D-glutamate--2,6-diaminopimelate ligase